MLLLVIAETYADGYAIIDMSAVRLRHWLHAVYYYAKITRAITPRASAVTRDIRC